MIEERSWGSRLFDVFNHVFVGVLALSCLVPLVHVAAVSLSGRAASEAGYVSLWPINFTLANYRQVMMSPQFRRSFTVSAMRLVLGVSVQIFLTALTAYPLATPERFGGRVVFRWMLIVGMLFSGGLIPMYLTLRNLKLLDTLFALVLPGALPIFYVIVLLNFFRGLPQELSESASIDGASHWQILFRIYLPLSLPSLATLTLFSAVGHWNSWFDGLVYILNPKNYPLQSYLQIAVIQSRVDDMLSTNKELLDQISNRSLRSAQVMFATLPILVVYPLLQRYFVTGLTLGSVKG